MEIEKLKKRFEEIEEIDIDEVDINLFEEKVYKLEEEVQNEIYFSFSQEKAELIQLLHKIARFKKENDFYNAEDELDRMFPNRGDDDFDEDSTSFESVFGKE